MSKEFVVGLLFGNLGDTLDKVQYTTTWKIVLLFVVFFFAPILTHLWKETQEQLSSWNPKGLFDFDSIGVTEGDENSDKVKNTKRYDDGGAYLSQFFFFVFP